jgi:hypothetical protein
MKRYPKLESLRKKDREQLLYDNPGFIARIAKKIDRTPATVSRVFHGKIDRSPEVKQAIEDELETLPGQAGPPVDGFRVCGPPDV